MSRGGPAPGVAAGHLELGEQRFDAVVEGGDLGPVNGVFGVAISGGRVCSVRRGCDLTDVVIELFYEQQMLRHTQQKEKELSHKPS